MKITRVLNNNAVLGEEKGNQLLLMGLSVGYQKKPGMRVDEAKVEHRFLLTDPASSHLLEQIYRTIPEEYFTFTGEMLEQVSDRLHYDFNGNLLVHLTDHIFTATERCREGVTVNNALLLDIEQYYPEEYAAALMVVEKLNEKFSVSLGEEEAGFITFHFLEAELELKDALSEIKMITTILNRAVKIVKDYFAMEFDTGSMAYSRFLVHLKFLAQRAVRKIHVRDTVDEELLNMVRSKYHREADCAEHIIAYIRKDFHFEPSGFETLYLTMHISRVTKEGLP